MGTQDTLPIVTSRCQAARAAPGYTQGLGSCIGSCKLGMEAYARYCFHMLPSSLVGGTHLFTVPPHARPCSGLDRLRTRVTLFLATVDPTLHPLG